MSEPLKLMYNVQFFERLCPVLTEVIPDFNERKFIHAVFNDKWPDLELKQRTRQITLALHQCLPVDFSKAVDLIVNVSAQLRRQGWEQHYPFIFLPDYIEVYGLENFAVSMKGLEECTKLVSAEFAVRPFIVRYQEQAMKFMLSWSTHPEPAVRRLSSEGCRPRLPWAMGLPAFKKDPSSILPILENLKSDMSEYVRRSVANNLNDIAKDHPDIVLNVAKKWRGKSVETDWILKHGCRTLLKKGQKEALHLHGFNPTVKADIKNLKLSNKVPVGRHLEFEFDFSHREKRSALFRFEYAIDYLTRTGKTSRKVFKLNENVYPPDSLVHFTRKQSFKNFTTRKHYKGKHYLSILANGKELAKSEFLVC
jgi:3-methyladenine DNA glycosylase AlkC